MQNLLNDLINILKKDKRLFVDGELLKNKTQELALANDEELLKSLLGSKKIKDNFFVSVAGALIFDKDKFIKFISNKEFLPDSYTAFKNKIGLTEGDEYLSLKKDVVLSWPYKDCVLEGGQTKEDAKRNEIFWNETLAPDDISRLFEPKVTVNYKRFYKNQEKDVQKIDSTENLVIKGNNLLVLHSLKEKYKNKIKLVYLDPPYNTPGEANTFSYNNSFNHSSWLTFMKNRIEVVKDLVSDDGFICLAIDDVEYAYLKVLCDEILGRENFIATVVVQIKKEGRTDSGFFATSHDYSLFYCKNKSKAKLNTLNISEENSRKWKETDETGRFYWRDFVRTGGNSTPKDRPNQDFVIYYSENEKEIVGVGGYSNNKPADKYNSDVVYYLNDNGEFSETDKKSFKKKFKKLIEFLPTGSKGERQVWRWSDREKFLWAAKMGEIALIENKIKIKDRIREGSKPTTTWYDSDFNATSHGTLLLKKLFNGKKVFSYPKSLFTMIDIINITTNRNTNDIVLDVFGGSATTAHAVSRVNKYDNGNRKFIIAEQMDYIESATIPRIKKSLNGDDSFVFFELLKLNNKFIDSVKNSKNKTEIKKIWNDIKGKGYLSYKLDIKKVDRNAKDFESLSLDDQKKFLLEALDKNQLYVNLGDIDDKSYKISAEDKKLNKMFYNN